MLIDAVWTPLALPTLKIVLPKLRRGSVVLADNTVSGEAAYKDLLTFLRAPDSGFINMTLPFSGGFGMSVYNPSV